MMKVIVCIATMTLVDDGKLHLDQPVSQILPAFADLVVANNAAKSLADVRPAKNSITIRNLLTHTHGHARLIAGLLMQRAMHEAEIPMRPALATAFRFRTVAYAARLFAFASQVARQA